MKSQAEATENLSFHGNGAISFLCPYPTRPFLKLHDRPKFDTTFPLPCKDPRHLEDAGDLATPFQFESNFY
ncbi:hypothetical protein CKA32_004283 [Geitlerinema sp. FC II]|nr:hypothetical protein CKA32_004283 [Geitlerinema sp. FC II]